MSRRFRLTREGRVYVVVTVLVGVAAINTGNNLLYLVLSLLLGLLLLSGMLSDLSLHRLRVELSLPARLEAGRGAYAEVVVRNGKRWLSSFSIVVSPLDGDASLGDALFLKVAPGERATSLVRVVPERRGELAVRYVEVRTQYPFALVDKRRRLPLSERVLVHPRATFAEAATGARDERAEVARSVARGRGEEVTGLREIQPFEVVDDLHFARSAALGRWVRREHGAQRRPTTFLILDERDDGEPELAARLERRIEAVASRARSLHRRGESVGLVTASQRVDPIDRERSLTPLLDVLATLEARPSDASPPELPREVRRAERAG
jgi:uncharacterized protein (DUF58 family)